MGISPPKMKPGLVLCCHGHQALAGVETVERAEEGHILKMFIMLFPVVFIVSLIAGQESHDTFV